MLVGGTPCQDFSNAGLGKGGEEGSGTRSSLMWYYIKLIALSKPKIVVWENVAAVISIKHIHTYRKFCHTLSGLGYRLNADILNAKYFNVPQNRTRLILVAVRKDLKIDFEYPHGYDSGVRIKDLLEHKVKDKYYTKTLDDVEPYNRYFSDTFRIMPLGKIKGAIYKQCNEVLCTEGIFDCLTTKQGNYILDEHSSHEKTYGTLRRSKHCVLWALKIKTIIKAGIIIVKMKVQARKNVLFTFPKRIFTVRRETVSS